MMTSRERVKNILIDKAGESIEFFIHESVKGKQREKVIKTIEKHGGNVVDTNYGVDTVVVDPQYPDASALQIQYNVHSDRRYWHTRVEDTQFVYYCVKLGRFEHTPVKRRPMRGNRPGRTNFTQEDEERLCRYLAIRTPNPESGGRLGHKIYEEFVSLGTLDPIESAWTLRHPPESWREHYRSKKNRPRLDARIQELVTDLNPTDEQLYVFDRRLNRPWPPRSNEPQEHPQEGFGRYRQRKNIRLRMEQIAARQEEEESSDDTAEQSGDEAHRPTSLFSADEDAGDNGVPQKATTQDRSPSTCRRCVTDEPGNSEATLVVQKLAYKSPTRPLRVSKDTAPQQMDEDSDEHDNRLKSPDTTAIAGRELSPQRMVSPVVLNPVQALPRRMRRTAQAAPAYDPPYRNTRSRSAAPPLITEHRKKGQRNVVVDTLPSPQAEAEEELPAGMIPTVDPVEEAAKSTFKVPQSKRRMREETQPVSISETLHEEADVVRLLSMQLNEHSTSSSIQQQPSWGQSGNSSPLRDSQRHLRSMDTDDEQTDKKLNSSDGSWSKSDAHNPHDLLKEFSRASRRHMTSTSARANPLAPLPKIEDADGFLMTPSEDTFPLPGTRANVAKKRYEEERKREEYVPPPSTRAAQYKRTLG